jgi:phosphoribosylformylglycinamidine cyclo-ligase
MHRVFNCGIGFVVVVAREDAGRALALLREAGEEALEIGRIEPRRDAEAPTVVV